MNKYFGTDGIRGNYPEFINEKLVYDIGRAVGVFEVGRVIVGIDSRESSPSLKKALIKGLEEAGFSYYDLNLVTTPLLIYLSNHYKSLGIMITASHNVYTDNGVKIIYNGDKIDDKMASLLESKLGETIKVNSDPIPFFSIYPYIKMMQSFVIDKNFKAIFDLANGSASYIYNDVIPQFPFKEEVIMNNPDGKNINQETGLNQIENIVKNIGYEGADYGFSLDGDGDRLLVADKDGNVYDGDSIIYCFANYLKSTGDLLDDTVVLNEDTNPGLRESLKNIGIKTVIVPVGDRHIREAIKKNNYSLGGETSGHITVSKYQVTGDGLLNALLLLQILSEKKKSLKEMCAGLNLYNVERINVADYDQKIISSKEFKEKIHGMRDHQKEFELILVRKSGTENLVRISVSTGDKEKDKEIAQRIVLMIKKSKEIGE